MSKDNNKQLPNESERHRNLKDRKIKDRNKKKEANHDRREKRRQKMNNGGFFDKK